MKLESHHQTVIDQFSKQAPHFAKLSGHEAADQLLLQTARPTPNSEVLDVACGPGLLACAFAPHALKVTGIDATPAMIERAMALQTQRGLTNMSWQIGDVNKLPYSDGQFEIVISRYSLHHFIDPASVLREMVRVLRPGGRIVLADLLLPARKALRYDPIERLRDPSHVHVLSRDDLQAMCICAGLSQITWSGDCFELRLDNLMAASFPNQGDAGSIRKAFEADVGLDELGVGLTQKDGHIWLNYPITVISAVGPSSNHEE
jgi:SAM-dependent methyltransferase